MYPARSIGAYVDWYKLQARSLASERRFTSYHPKPIEANQDIERPKGPIKEVVVDDTGDKLEGTKTHQCTRKELLRPVAS